MRVAIYTLTRDRLELTKTAFASLADRAGWSYDHYVFDNGSADGTPEWLLQRQQEAGLHWVLRASQNVGISIASNICLEAMKKWGPYDLIVKMDNDCEVLTPDLLRKLVDVFKDNRRWSAQMALSPKVVGIVNQPKRARVEGRGGLTVGVTGMIGGLFHVLPWEVYQEWRYPETLPLAWGQDDALCQWLNEHGVTVGYVEELEVGHQLTTDGQAQKYPQYFERKWKEEKLVPMGVRIVNADDPSERQP